MRGCRVAGEHVNKYLMGSGGGACSAAINPPITQANFLMNSRCSTETMSSKTTQVFLSFLAKNHIHD